MVSPASSPTVFPAATGAARPIRDATGIHTATARTAGTAQTARENDQPPSATASGTATADAIVAPIIIETT